MRRIPSEHCIMNYFRTAVIHAVYLRLAPNSQFVDGTFFSFARITLQMIR